MIKQEKVNQSKRFSNNKDVIIWALDPLQDPNEAKNLIKELRTWSSHLGCDVQPVAVFGSLTKAFPFSWENNTERLAQEIVGRYLKKAQCKDFLSPNMVFAATLSNRKMASELSKYAESKKAIMIFANTRAKKTWNPFRMGGFAETLIATSRVPVLLLNPTAQPSSKISSILFPTEFSRESKTALINLAPWAKAFNSKILIYNQVENFPFYPMDFSGTLPPVDTATITKDVEKSRTKKAHAWIQLLEERDLNCSALVSRQKKYLSADILDIANKNQINLIALASNSGPVSQTLLGGVAQDVLLQAKCPVLIFHKPKAVRKQAATKKHIVSQKIYDRKPNPRSVNSQRIT